MPLFCPECGNEDDFRMKYEEERSYKVEATCDEEGDYVDEIDSELIDSFGEKFNEYFICDNCEEDDLENLEDDAITLLKVKHTDKNGDWHAEELPREEWNEELHKEYGTDQI